MEGKPQDVPVMPPDELFESLAITALCLFD
jgi:hypothetical protein